MSATDYRKALFVQDGNRMLALECADGAHVTFMIEGFAGYSPQLDESDVNALIDALVEAKQVMTP